MNVYQLYNKDYPLASKSIRVLACCALILLTGCAHPNRSENADARHPEELPVVIEATETEPPGDETVSLVSAPAGTGEAATKAAEAAKGFGKKRTF